MHLTGARCETGEQLLLLEHHKLYYSISVNEAFKAQSSTEAA